MLFLLNAQILDITNTTRQLSLQAAAEGRTTPTLYLSVLDAQRLLFAQKSFSVSARDDLLRIASHIALASEANAALFVEPPDATKAEDVAVRLGSVPLTTMALLSSLQERGCLTAGAINREVWDQAPLPQQS